MAANIEGITTQIYRQAPSYVAHHNRFPTNSLTEPVDNRNNTGVKLSLRLVKDGETGQPLRYEQQVSGDGGEQEEHDELDEEEDDEEKEQEQMMCGALQYMGLQSLIREALHTLDRP